MFEQLARSYECNCSTWTIDLLYLLHQSGIRAVLSTVTLGCSPTYEHVPYYQSLLDKDRERVNQLFDSQAAHVKMASLDWSDLKAHLIEYRMPCLVLVDANRLDCCACTKSLFGRFLDNVLPNLSSPYQGHYVLVIGFTISDTIEYIRYVDPARTDGFCTTTKQNFDHARKAFGTDEDVILCYTASEPCIASVR